MSLKDFINNRMKMYGFGYKQALTKQPEIAGTSLIGAVFDNALCNLLETLVA